MSKTYKILLRMNAEDSKALDQLKKQYGTTTATVALTRAMYDVAKYCKEIDSISSKVQTAERNNSSLKDELSKVKLDLQRIKLELNKKIIAS